MKKERIIIYDERYIPVFHNVFGYEVGYYNYYNTATEKYDRKKFADCSHIEEGQFGAVKLLSSKKQTYYSPYTKHLCKARFLSCSDVSNGYGVVKIEKNCYTYFCPETEALCQRTFRNCRPLDALGFGPVQLEDETWGLYNPTKDILRDERFEDEFRASAFEAELRQQAQEQQA